MNTKSHKSLSHCALASRPKGFDEQTDEHRQRAIEACTDDDPCLLEDCPRCADYYAPHTH